VGSGAIPIHPLYVQSIVTHEIPVSREHRYPCAVFPLQLRIVRDIDDVHATGFLRTKQVTQIREHFLTK
jgi:hypothetical protein